MAIVQENNTDQSSRLVRQFNEGNASGSETKQGILVGLVVLLIIATGIFSGYTLANRDGAKVLNPGEVPQKGQEVGSGDEKTFKDTASGVLEKGGLNGEGTHKLVREGGPSQTAYLTSSVVDLDQFDGKKVQVWGETFKGEKVGWLMDVGRVKVID